MDASGAVPRPHGVAHGRRSAGRRDRRTGPLGRDHRRRRRPRPPRPHRRRRRPDRRLPRRPPRGRAGRGARRRRRLTRFALPLAGVPVAIKDNVAVAGRGLHRRLRGPPRRPGAQGPPRRRPAAQGRRGRRRHHPGAGAVPLRRHRRSRDGEPQPLGHRALAGRQLRAAARPRSPPAPCRSPTATTAWARCACRPPRAGWSRSSPAAASSPAEIGADNWSGMAVNGALATTVADLALAHAVLAGEDTGARRGPGPAAAHRGVAPGRRCPASAPTPPRGRPSTRPSRPARAAGHAVVAPQPADHAGRRRRRAGPLDGRRRGRRRAPRHRPRRSSSRAAARTPGWAGWPAGLGLVRPRTRSGSAPAWSRFFGDVDVLLTPGDHRARRCPPGRGTSARSWPTSRPTRAGRRGPRRGTWPASRRWCSRPATGPDGPPVAVQIVGPPGAEGRLLWLAGELERRPPWRRYAPVFDPTAATGRGARLSTRPRRRAPSARGGGRHGGAGALEPAVPRRPRRPGTAVASSHSDRQGSHGPARRPRRPRAQPQGRPPRPPPRRTHRVHGALRLRQVQPRLRHDLRRGPAPVRRVAVGLRPAVPRADGQAGRRLHRGPLAGGVDRPEVDQPQPAVDRRHDHRGLRLPPPALRPRRPAALPQLRQADLPADAAADRRPGAGHGGGHPVPGARPGRPGAQGRVRRPVQLAADPGLLPRPRRRHRAPAHRAAEAQEAGEAHDRGHRRPAHGQGERQAPAHRLGGDRARAWPAASSSSTSSTSTSTTRSASAPSPSTSPASTTACPSRRWSRARSPSTRPSAPAPSAPASAPARRSTPSSSSPTRRRASARAPSRRGPAR